MITAGASSSAGGPPVAFTQISPSGGDDTLAVAAAVASAVAAGQANGSNYAEVWFAGNGAAFKVSGSQVKGGATLGNSKIPLPVIPATGEKFTLILRGVRDASANPHWLQTVAQISGAVLVDTTSPTNDVTWGYPSIIGGPTPQGLGGTDGGFSNMLVIVDGLTLVNPLNPFQIGFDFRCCAGAGVKTAAVLANSTPSGGLNNSSAFTNGSVGLYLPAINNNDYCEVEQFTAYGQQYGIGFADHANVKRLAAIYCNTALIMNNGGSGTKTHGARFGYVSVEACQVGLDGTLGSAAATFPITIDLMDVETNGGNHVKDPNNVFCGFARIADENEAISVSGAANLIIENPYQPRGNTAPPAVPASGTAFAVLYRDAVYTFTGGTVTAITVDGHATGTTSGPVLVPAGKTISVTYSVVPTLSSLFTL